MTRVLIVGRSADDEIVSAEIVLVVVGVRPQTRLALDAGTATGARGAIQVDRRMQLAAQDWRPYA